MEIRENKHLIHSESAMLILRCVVDDICVHCKVDSSVKSRSISYLPNAFACLIGSAYVEITVAFYLEFRWRLPIEMVYFTSNLYGESIDALEITFCPA